MIQCICTPPPAACMHRVRLVVRPRQEVLARRQALRPKDRARACRRRLLAPRRPCQPMRKRPQQLARAAGHYVRPVRRRDAQRSDRDSRRAAIASQPARPARLALLRLCGWHLVIVGQLGVRTAWPDRFQARGRRVSLIAAAGRLRFPFRQHRRRRRRVRHNVRRLRHGEGIDDDFRRTRLACDVVYLAVVGTRRQGRTSARHIPAPLGRGPIASQASAETPPTPASSASVGKMRRSFTLVSRCCAPANV